MAEFDGETVLIAGGGSGIGLATARRLVAAGEGGSILLNGTVLVNQGMGLPFGLASLHASTKAAVVNLARSLAADLATRGIRINAVTPGFIETDMFDELVPVVEAREARRGQVPMGRLGCVDDVADAVTFLLPMTINAA